MFAYCRNNPVCRKDISGNEDVTAYFDDGSDGTAYNEPIDPDDACAGSKTGTLTSGNVGGSSSSSLAGKNNSGGHTIGTGHAPKSGAPGSKYTQISSDGQKRIISETTYDENGMPIQRIDYSGRDHGIGLPHIHVFINGMVNGALHRMDEVTMRYWGDGGEGL